jgi:hypothetical protein
MITLVCGKPGSGKTSFIAAKAVESMTVGASARCSLCCDEIYLLNEGGFSLSYPEYHITYADFPVCSNVRGYPSLSSFEISLPDFGLPSVDDSEENNPIFVPPYSAVFFDEAAKTLNSRDWQNLAMSMRVRFETHRHVGLDIYMTVHSGIEIDKSLRILADCVVEIQSVRTRSELYTRGRRVRSVVWDIFVFEDISFYAAYLNNPLNKRLYRRVSYVFRGDIFSCYDSRAFFAFHYRNNYFRDFDYVESSFVGKDVASIKAFNDAHIIKDKFSSRSKNKGGVENAEV